ncbi:MAG: rod shape-determining protein MreC [Streptococcaceae bacterium]|jgi:rod shape-determining protein MreC|nr:rod shape-determining protein MreC [Streptococcaceae bacterium]
MKNINFSKIIIIGLIIVIASFSAISLTARSYQNGDNPNELVRVINDGTGTIDELFTNPGRYLQDKVAAFQNVLAAYNQNENLKKELTKLSNQQQQLNAALAENKSLKEALKLQDTLTDYTTVNANVITRNPSSWNDVLVIDKGAAEGLSVNMIVMANGGAIGRISQVNGSTSKIELLTSSKNLADKVPVKIGNSYGVLNSYDSTTNDYIVTNVQSDETFTKGEQVVTSGLGGSGSPSQLLLGSVVGQTGESNSMSRKIYVKPSANFYDLQVVTVVKSQIAGN